MFIENATLEISGFLKTILYLIVFYYLGKFLLRNWLTKKIKEQQERLKNTVSEQEAQHKRKTQGKVTITVNNEKNKPTSEGEYVDYEEVK